MPKVSVIITTHSRPHSLPRAIESAFKAGTDVEVVVVDDASTDSTAEVCKNIKGINYVRLERNQRVGGARNIGIVVSNGEYIAFLDDDDVRLPGSLDEQAAVLDANPEVGLVYGQILVGDENCKPLDVPPMPDNFPEGDLFHRLMTRSLFACQAPLFRKSCFLKVGMVDKSLAKIDDMDLWIRISELYPIKGIEKPVAIWRKATGDEKQGSSNTVEMFGLAYNAYKKKWSQLPRYKEFSSKEKQEAKQGFFDWATDTLVWSASEKFRDKDYLLGIQTLAAACYYNLFRTIHPKTIRAFFKSLKSENNLG